MELLNCSGRSWKRNRQVLNFPLFVNKIYFIHNFPPHTVLVNWKKNSFFDWTKKGNPTYPFLFFEKFFSEFQTPPISRKIIKKPQFLHHHLLFFSFFFYYHPKSTYNLITFFIFWQYNFNQQLLAVTIYILLFYFSNYPSKFWTSF